MPEAEPNIETKRLLLRTMRADDVDDLFAIFTDPRVMALFGGSLFDRIQMERWLQRNLEHQQQYGYGLFAVIFSATGCFIGDCGLENMEIEGVVETELGYDLHSDHWQRGLATEAAMAVRDYAFGDLKLCRLVSLIRHGNRASRRVAEKIGMRVTAELTRGAVAYRLYSISAAEVPSD